MRACAWQPIIVISLVPSAKSSTLEGFAPALMSTWPTRSSNAQKTTKVVTTKNTNIMTASTKNTVLASKNASLSKTAISPTTSFPSTQDPTSTVPTASISTATAATTMLTQVTL